VTDQSANATAAGDEAYLVMSHAAPGQERDYADWYRSTHLGQVLAIEGFASAELFEVADDGARAGLGADFLCIYRFNGDARETLERMRAARAAGSIDPATLNDPALPTRGALVREIARVDVGGYGGR
jgi:hypothetical protein